MIAEALKRQGGNLLLLAIGAYFFFGSLTGLDLGTARRMGPGFFPMAIGAILCLLALIEIIATARRNETMNRPEYRSVLAIIGAGIAFAFGTPLLGVVPATFLTVLIAGSADPRLSLRTRALLGVIVSIVIWLIFIVGLQLPFVAVRGL